MRSVLALLVLIALTFVTFDARASGRGVFGEARAWARGAAQPVQHALHSALSPVGNFLWGSLHYKDLERENERLRAEVVAAQTKVVQAATEQAQAQQVLAGQH